MDSKRHNLIEYETRSFKDYINIIRTHLVKVILITLLIFTLSVVYAITAKDIFRATTVLKITPPEGGILESPIMGGLGLAGTQADRFISNEIETMKNITIREQVAKKIKESFKVVDQKEKFSLILDIRDYFDDNGDSLKSTKSLADLLMKRVDIKQKEGLDFIEVTAESPSPYEAALIVNSYANVYRRFNLMDNRKQVSAIKDFLKIQKEEKYEELLKIEDQYKEYQMKGKALVLDQQATSLIETIAQLEAKKNNLSIGMSVSKKALDQYTAELEKKDLSVSKYLESKAGEPYLEILQQQIAELEANRDFALSSKSKQNRDAIVEQYNAEIQNLKEKLNKRTEQYRNSILTASPEEIRGLSRQIFEEDVKHKSLSASYDQVVKQLKTYEKRFDKLPKASIGLARLERSRLAAEKIYTQLEEKYQEALLNEQATTGNVLILSTAREPDKPAKPNRKLIVVLGLFVGLVFGVGYAIVANYFDKTVKTPEDIEDMHINLLGWIPQIDEFGSNGKFSEFFIANNMNTISSDAFKFLRTTMNYSQTEGAAKVLLITSSAPSEGKSVISSNLAGSYAIAKKKTLLIDCDLRKPRVHTIFNKKRVPGLVDYLYGKATYEDITSLTEVKDLSIIPVGTIPQNPTEFLDSSGMKSFLNRVKQEFEVVIIDSPPLTTLADAVILSRLVDETILVASSNVTDSELLQKSVEQLIRIEGSTFKGVVLNRFNLKKSYGSYYYKYASHYARDKKK